jgi:hypothetical protein
VTAVTWPHATVVMSAKIASRRRQPAVISRNPQTASFASPHFDGNALAIRVEYWVARSMMSQGREFAESVHACSLSQTSDVDRPRDAVCRFAIGTRTRAPAYSEVAPDSAIWCARLSATRHRPIWRVCAKILMIQFEQVAARGRRRLAHRLESYASRLLLLWWQCYERGVGYRPSSPTSPVPAA